MEENKNIPEAEVTEETEPGTPETEAAEEAPVEEAQPDPTEELKAKLMAEHDNYLRLAAEYDNFRKRTQKEREALYTDIKAETVGKFLPVFDNLQ
ncbi:MAG: nucleotide exchange factor GrpE, partial [Oscillospiraceae bacterium]|nr:nucleotide exchange factor GrpE [Oscillospiraceae bacterium]